MLSILTQKLTNTVAYGIVPMRTAQIPIYHANNVCSRRMHAQMHGCKNTPEI